MPNDADWLAAQLKHEKAVAKWRAPRASPERQCTATTRSKQRCKAPRAKRPDGTLATTCRHHGGGPVSLESQVKALRALVKLCVARLKGAQSKLAAKELELERERVMEGSANDHTHMVTYGHYVSAGQPDNPVRYSSEIEDGQSLQPVSGGQPESSQAPLSEQVGGSSPDRSIGPTSNHAPLPPIEQGAKKGTGGSPISE